MTKSQSILGRLKMNEQGEKLPKVRFFPVIHVVDTPQMIESITIAKAGGADGVFLIHHNMPAEDFSNFLKRVSLRIHFGDFPIGVNFLGAFVARASQLYTREFFALWSDDSGVRENSKGVDTNITQHVLQEMKDKNPASEFFGGVAFKYQRQPKDLDADVRTV